MYCLFCVVLCIVCVQMCTELLPPGGYPTAINNIYSIYIIYHMRFQFEQDKLRTTEARYGEFGIVLAQSA
jgi:hypothetical protein